VTLARGGNGSSAWQAAHRTLANPFARMPQSSSPPTALSENPPRKPQLEQDPRLLPTYGLM